MLWLVVQLKSRRWHVWKDRATISTNYSNSSIYSLITPVAKILITDIYSEKTMLIHLQNTEQVNYDYILTVLQNVYVY